MIDECSKQESRARGIVIIPARNEAESIKNVLFEVQRCLDWEVVVIDDASEDKTQDEIQEFAGVQVLKMPFRVGAWGAIQAGMEYARHGGYTVAVTMDADGQHPASALPAVCDPVIEGVADVAIGICPERVSRLRYVAWVLFKRITGLDIQDITSGLRAYNAEAMKVLTNSEATMLSYQDIGVLLMLREAGMKAAEVKVDMEVRRNGRSRVYDSWWAVARYLMETFILSAGKWRLSWHLDDMFVTSAHKDEKR